MSWKTTLPLVWALGACGSDAGGVDALSGVPSTLTNPYRVWAFAPDNVWILDSTATIHHYNGTGWDTLTAPEPVNCIWALSSSQVWLCGYNDVVLYDGATFTTSDVTTPTGLDGLTSVWASSASDVWAIGDDAIAAHWDGTSWERHQFGSPFKSGLWGSGPSDVYASSTFDLFHYDGTTWSEVTLQGASGDGALWGTSASDVWLTTGSDSIWHFDGSAWTEELDVGDTETVWAASPTAVWAGGNAGLIVTYDGDWSQVRQQKIGAPYLQQILSIHGSSETDVWAVGRQLGEGGSTPLVYHLGD